MSLPPKPRTPAIASLGLVQPNITSSLHLSQPSRSLPRSHPLACKIPLPRDRDKSLAHRNLRRSELATRTAGSGLNPLDRKQSEVQKKGTPTDKLKTIQKSTVRVSGEEKAKLRIARSEAKARASSGTTPLAKQTDISFGMLDGNAVRFTDLEAWWLIDGTWRPIPLDDVLSNAAVMREARFKQLFPNVPLLPKKAFQSHRR